MQKITTTFAAAALSLFALPVLAQDHSGHAMPGGNTDTPSTAAYMEAMEKMHTAMDVPYTGDADVDFIRGMIPHHQGAIDMAKVVLEYGKDPDVKKLAEEVISAQEKEITWMNDWLAKHGH